MTTTVFDLELQTTQSQTTKLFPVAAATEHYQGRSGERTGISRHRKMIVAARGLTWGCVLALTSPFLSGGPTRAGAASAPFSRIVVFGDSLSDRGNFFHLTGGLLPPAPYADGRFSNGPLWVEYLADDLGMEVHPEDNYAVAGATTGHDNSNDGVLGRQYPGLQDELAEFLESHQVGGADPDALYIVWAGANDFFVALKSGGSPATMIANGVNNTIQVLRALDQASARQIMVVNVPDLGLTPYGLSSGMGEAISHLCAAYNQTLETTLEAVGEAGVPTIRVDAFATLDAMVGSPGQFGFTNVTEAFLATGGDPAHFLFWDSVHPTTRGHEILADQARHDLVEFYSPRNGLGEPPSLVRSLNGLVEARKSAP